MLKKKKENISIYIVDEDELFLKILRNKFNTTTNFNVHTYTSASDFLIDILKPQQSKYEDIIVILNYDMETTFVDETKDGIEILKAIKDSSSNIEVIMLSTTDNVDAAATSMRFGAANFLKKNENAFMRIHNNIKFIISEKRLVTKRQQWIIATLWFLVFLLISVGLVISYIYFKF